MIRLFTTVYPELDVDRRREYEKCLNINAACQTIDQICLFCEGGEGVIPKSNKINIRQVTSRPTYQDYFDWITQLSSKDDISIICNTDIFFDDQFNLFTHWSMPEDVVFALSRWDYEFEETPILFDRNDSQDVWVFRGPLKEIQGDFDVGVPRCDNRILYELQRAGYDVINPAFSIRAYHLHDGVREGYKSENLDHFVDPPYAYLWPHNLWSLPRIVFHNICHPHARLSWRFDYRKFARTLPVRAINKALGFFR